MVNLSTVFEVNQTMTPGTTYFFTVIARNRMGLETTAISDGILVDIDSPTPGAVYNTKQFRNALHQFSTSSLSTSWHGFEDHQSSIKYFEVSIIETVSRTQINRTERVLFSNDYTFRNLHLQHNKSYGIRVRAFDFLQHFSPYVTSHPIKIDSTPPIGVQCEKFDDLYLEVPAIENQKSFLHSTTTVVSSVVSLKKNTIYKISVDVLKELHFKMVYFQLGNEVMNLYLSLNADSSYSSKHQFMSLYEGEVNLKIIFASRHDIMEEDIVIRLQQCSFSSVSQSPLIIRQINPGLLSVCSFIWDPESDIEKVLIGAGTTKGGYQIRPLLPFSSFNHGVVETDVPHGSRIYFTAVARNKAGQWSTFSKEITLDHTPPIISQLTVKIQNSEALEERTHVANMPVFNSSDSFTRRIIRETRVVATWNVSEDESELASCYCSVGKL